MKQTCLRIFAVINGLMMIGIGIFGIVAPSEAMTMMAGQKHPWDPSTLSLMQMHTAADLGIGVGFLLIAYRPAAAFSTLVLCLVGNLAHGAVHVIEEVHGGHPSENALPIIVLIVLSLLVAACYPWKQGLARFLEK